MPTDAELRTLFHDAPAPAAGIDVTTVIRRSRRRRLPQQLGVGSALTLAVAGIGFASISGLQGLDPSMTAADAPIGAAESGTLSEPGPSARNSCAAATTTEGEEAAGVQAVADFPPAAPAGHPVHGTLTLTNTGPQPMAGTVVGTAVTLSRAGSDVQQSDASTVGRSVSLSTDESVSFELTFSTIGCDAAGGSDGAPLEPGTYELTPTLTVEAADGTLWRAVAPASAIIVG